MNYPYQCTLCGTPTSMAPTFAVVFAVGESVYEGYTDFSAIDRPVCAECTQQDGFHPRVLRIATQDASQELRDQAIMLRPARPDGSA